MTSKNEWRLRQIDMRSVFQEAAGLLNSAEREDPDFLKKLEAFEDTVRGLRRAAHFKAPEQISRDQIIDYFLRRLERALEVEE